MTSETDARKRRDEGHAAVVTWFHTAVELADIAFDKDFDIARDNAVRVREQAQEIQRRGGDTTEAFARATQAQQLADTLRARKRPTHDDLRAEQDRRMEEVDREFNKDMARILGAQGRDVSHWRL